MRLELGGLASHNGSVFWAIYEATKNGELDANTRVLISNNKQAAALVRARTERIPAALINSATHKDEDAAIRDTLLKNGAEIVVLSGYMKQLGPQTLEAFKGRILNVHPALLPKFGGQGMYGDNVHQAVLNNHEEESGPTIHVVDEEYDHGQILAQSKIRVEKSDNVDSLRQKVQAAEKVLFVNVLKDISSGKLKIGIR